MVPGICRNTAGDVKDFRMARLMLCKNCADLGRRAASTYTYTNSLSGTITLDTPANIMASAGLRFTYNTSLFTGGTSPASCSGSADDHGTTGP